MNRYLSTILNHTIGRFWFDMHVVKHATPSDGQIVLSFDPDDRIDMEEMPWLLDLLKKKGMRASFAAIGAWVEEYPDIWKRTLEEGHEVINHTQTHPDNAELNDKHYHRIPREEREKEIRDCHETVKRVLDHEMKGFRTPHFGYQHTQDTYEILADMGYRFSSSMLAPEAGWKARSEIKGVLEFPLSPCPKHPWALFDSAHAFRGRFSKHSQEGYLRDWQRLLDSGIFLNIYLDPQDLKRFDFERMLDMINERDIETVVYEDLL